MRKAEYGIISTLGEYSNAWVILLLLLAGLIFAIVSVPYVAFS